MVHQDGGYEKSNSNTTGGKGAYVKGIFKLQNETTLYIYVGGEGTQYSETNVFNGGYNGGGNSYNGFGGGGASDVRLLKGKSSDSASLLTRILVAGGGGGSSKAKADEYGYGGSGGNNISASSGKSINNKYQFPGKGATWTELHVGYDEYKIDGIIKSVPKEEKGSIGKGGSVDFDGAGAGGGGYLGGSAAHDEYAGGGRRSLLHI